MTSDTESRRMKLEDVNNKEMQENQIDKTKVKTKRKRHRGSLESKLSSTKPTTSSAATNEDPSVPITDEKKPEEPQPTVDAMDMKPVPLLTTNAQDLPVSPRTAESRAKETQWERLRNIARQGSTPKTKNLQNPSATSSRPYIRRAALVCPLTVTALLVLMLFLLGKKELPFGVLCETDGCQEYSARVINRLNRTLSACDDFQAFVCSAWYSRLKSGDFVTSTLTEFVPHWVKAISHVLQQPHPRMEIAKKAKNMFSICMDGVKFDGTGKISLKKFMLKRHLAWPEQSPMTAGPLDILLDLDMNWDTPLWFRVTLFKSSNVTLRRILIVPGPYAIFWEKHNRHVSNYNAYWEEYFYALNLRNATKPSKTAIKESHTVQTTIFETLLNVTIHRPQTAASFSFNKIGTYTESIPLEQWIRALNNCCRSEEPFTGDEEVLIGDVFLLRSVNALFARYTKEVLVEHLAWWFVQMYGFLADRQLLEVQFGGQKSAALVKPYICVREVEQAFGLLVVSLYVRANILESERRTVNADLDLLHQTAVNMSQDVQWLDEEGRNRIAEKFQSSSRVVWPDEEFLTQGGLRKIYEDFPEDDNSLIDVWVEARIKINALKSGPLYEEIAKIPPNYLQPHMRYNTLLNQVKVSVAALARPMYYQNGSAAMFYGGVGFYFAKELVRAIDRRGLNIDVKGQVSTSWVSNKSKASIYEHMDCLGPENDVFPEIPAVEIAFSAFRRSVNLSAPSHAKTSSLYSEDEIFFITLCYMSCSRPGFVNPYAANCEKTVMNFPEFAKAFRCPEGSKMNPRKKCHFFGPANLNERSGGRRSWPVHEPTPYGVYTCIIVLNFALFSRGSMTVL